MMSQTNEGRSIPSNLGEMSLNSDVDREIYQLFTREALQLLGQIEQILPDLYRDCSFKKIQELVRAAHTIKGGAAQVKLTNIQTIASQLENSFRCLSKKNIEVDRELVEQLQIAYQFLRQSLLSEIETGNGDRADFLDEAELVFARLKVRLGKNPSFDEDEFANINQVEDNVKLLILSKEVGEALENLEKLLANSKDEQLLAELQTQITMFLDLGTILEISEFVTIAQITLATLEASPEAVRNIGQLALVGFRAARRAVLTKTPVNINSAFPFEAEPIEPLESEVLDLFVEESQTNQPVIEEQKPTRSLRVCVDRPLELDTSKLLVWQAGCNIFTLPYIAIEKNISSKLIETIDCYGQKFLQWPQDKTKSPNSRLLKIYSLWQLLEYQYRSDRATQPYFSSNANKISILIIKLGELFFGLETPIERLIMAKEITILPIDPLITPPDYIYGCTILNNKLPAPVIDLNVLLTLTLDRANIFDTPDDTLPTSSGDRDTTVLIVDDSATLLQVLYRTLQKAGYRVTKAKDGREAIERLEQNSEIQLIISDWEMPNINGLEFLVYCRQEMLLNEVPFILLTTRNSDSDRDLANNLGATAYFTKPYNESEFLAAISSIIESSS